jgi:zinc transport system substrate-binding protein
MAFAAALAGCNSAPMEKDKPIISVSILPQKYFVEKISGDQFTIQVMVPPGESSHTYDPTPEQMVQFSNSNVYFLIGHIEFEKSWIRKLQIDHPEIRFYDTSAGLDFQNTDHGSHDGDPHGIDPHIWMSAISVKEIAINMAGFLSSEYPENTETYNDNLKRFIQELDTLHHFIQNELRVLKRREFIIYHPALTYFANDYDLLQIPIEEEGKEPSARHLKSLIDHAQATGIKAILVQQQFNQQEAKTLEKEINGKIILMDPLDYHWMDQMKHLTVELKKALE